MVLSVVNALPAAAEAEAEAEEEAVDEPVALVVPEVEVLVAVEGSLVPCVIIPWFPPGYSDPGAATKSTGTLVSLEQ